jgi:hypothetical protein
MIITNYSETNHSKLGVVLVGELLVDLQIERCPFQQLIKIELMLLLFYFIIDVVYYYCSCRFS